MYRCVSPFFLVLFLAAGASLARADEVQPAKKEAIFGLTKVWSMHLTVQAADWEKMLPTRQPGPPGFGPRILPPPAEGEGDRKPRGGFSIDYEYVKADLEIDGKKFKDVAVRYKGNSSYMVSSRLLKKPLKIDFDRYNEGQNWLGLKKISLSNDVIDSSAVRENLAYALYRAAGVPAPRTAYVQMTLTVPGKYDREFVGLYTLIEPIDKPFLRERFGDAKGMLLKPEKVGPLDYLGEEWSRYEERYQPKTDTTKKQQRRLIELTRLVHRADEKRFHKEIANHIDVDEWCRYLACTVLLSSLDSFIGLGHNYYLYLEPKSNRFIILPWDCDHAFAAMPMFGRPAELIDLSIKQPSTRANKLIDRLFADEKVYASYKGHLERLLKDVFTVDDFKRDLAAIHKVIEPIKQKERKAMMARKEGMGGFGMFGFGPPATDLVDFVAKRSQSVQDQLAGKSQGTVLASRFGFGPGPGGPGPGGPGFGPGMFLIKPILEASDKNKDGKLSQIEAIQGLQALFQACDTDGKGTLDQKTLTAELDRLLPTPGFPPGPRGPGGPLPGVGPAPPGGGQGGPPPGGPGGFRPRFMSLGETIAKVLIEKAGKDGKLTEDNLLAAGKKLFTEADKDKNGQLDERELGQALQQFLPPPRLPGFGGPPPGDRPVAPPDNKKSDSKKSQAEGR